MASRTFLELQDQTLVELDEDPSSPVFHTRTIVKDAINDAYRALAVDAEFFRKNVTFNLTDQVFDYNVLDQDETVISIQRTQNPTTGWWLRGTTLAELDAHLTSWIDVFAEPERMLPRSPWQFTLFPGVSGAGKTLTMQCTATPTALSADGDTVSVFIEEFERALIEHAKAHLLAQEREWEKADMALEKYEAHVEVIRNWVQKRGHAVKGVMGAN